MLTPKTHFSIACAVVIAGCSDPTGIEPTGLTKIDQFSMAWQYPLSPSDYASSAGDGHYLAFDGNNDLVVVNPKFPDAQVAQGCAAILRFASDGTQLGTLPFDKSDPPEEPFIPCVPGVFVGVDNNKDIITAGAVFAKVTDFLNVSYDIFVRKLDGEGTTVWTRYYQGDTAHVMYVRDLAIDVQNNILVAGAIGLSGGTKPWVGKYDPQGNVLWTYVAEYVSGSVEAIETDAKGNIWLTISTINHYSYLLERLSPNGDTLLLIHAENSLALSADGLPITAFNGIMHKYRANGNPLWQTAIGVDQHMNFDLDSPNPIAVAPDGSIYTIIEGYADECQNRSSCVPSGIPVAILAKYSADDGHRIGAWYYARPTSDFTFLDMIIGKDGAIALLGNQFVGMVAPLE
jgi:hypothetical protein